MDLLNILLHFNRETILEWLPAVIWTLSTIIIYKIYSFYGKEIRDHIIKFAVYKLKIKRAKKTICELHRYTAILVLLLGGLYVIDIAPFTVEKATALSNVFKWVYVK